MAANTAICACGYVLRSLPGEDEGPIVKLLRHRMRDHGVPEVRAVAAREVA